MKITLPIVNGHSIRVQSGHSTRDRKKRVHRQRSENRHAAGREKKKLHLRTAAESRTTSVPPQRAVQRLAVH